MDSTELDELLTETDGDSDLIRKLRTVAKEQGKENRALRTENQGLQTSVQGHEKSAVFDAIGIPTSGPGVKIFRDTYDGDLDEASVRAAAEAAEIIQPPQPSASPAEQQVHAAIDAAGSSPPAAPPDLKARIAAAQTSEELKDLMTSEGFAWEEGIF